MTLEELMERFPHGSRWRVPNDDRVWQVVGWEPQDIPGFDLVVRTIAGRGSPRLDRLESHLTRLERIPDPVPCPITEPVTLHGYRSQGNAKPTYTVAWHGLDVTDPAVLPDITVHPPDAENPRGWLSWEGGPE